MKYLLSLAVIMLAAITGKAQSAPTEERTQNIAAIIYTSDNLSDEIQKLCDARDQRSFAVACIIHHWMLLKELAEGM